MKTVGNEKNVAWHHATVTRKRRETQNQHRSVILWFAGLSSAGKSTLAPALEEQLHQGGCRTFVFDGDNADMVYAKILGFLRRIDMKISVASGRWQNYSSKPV